MGSSDADSAAPSRSSAAAITVAVLLVLLASAVLVRTTSAVDPWVALVAVAVGAAVALVLTWGATGTTADGETESDVWDVIPNRQYEGRHVESGGLARGEQEQALEDVQQQAEELERDR